MKDRFRQHLPLFAVLSLAAALRVPLLGSNPPGFFIDEASAGYDAFCLLLTGRDQFGALLPLYARSLGDYDEAMYRYLAVPCIAVFGLTEFATRLPAALAGIAGVAGLWSLARALFGRRIAFLSALCLAISPWHTHFSRIAFRGILLPLFLCLGLAAFFRRERTPRALVWSGLWLGLSLLTYSPARIFVPLLVLALSLLHWESLKSAGRPAIIGLVIFLAILAIPAAFSFTPEGSARARVTLSESPGQTPQNWLSYYSPGFLFMRGDPEMRHSVQAMGELHWFEAIAAAIGLCWIVRRRSPSGRFLLAWLLLYPMPAALTAPSHALRAIAGAPLFALLSGCGLAAILDRFRGRAPRAAPFLCALVILGSAGFYSKKLFVDYARQAAPGWLYGMRDTMHFAMRGDYTGVYFSDAFFTPHLYILFYAKCPPRLYQKGSPLKLEQGMLGYSNYSVGRYHVISMGKPWPLQGRSLIIAMPEESEAVRQWHPGAREALRVAEPSGRIAAILYEAGGDGPASQGVAAAN